MVELSTVRERIINGMHCLFPNVILNGVGFYVSYNNYDVDIYGTDTTALVWGQMENFYILEGDHREGYKPLLDSGFDACLEYFKNNLELVSKFSETLPVVEKKKGL